MIKTKPKKCSGVNCSNTFTPQRLTTEKYCSYACANSRRKPQQINKKRRRITRTTIRPVGKKQATRNTKYDSQSKDFLKLPENQKCPVTGQQTVEVHHKMGRKGYADDYARDNKIWLVNDVRFFLAVSRAGHEWIENNPVEAKRIGYSLDRLANYGEKYKG